jgi:hypothetical protein
MDNIFSYKDKSILYICQNGTSGYANAAKGYIYDYIGKKIPVKTQYFNCSDEINENDKFHQYLNSNTSTDIEYNTIIVHSTPDIWTTVIKNAPNINLEKKTIIGRTVWEFEKLLPSWVDAINNGIVDIVSVPTEWNKQCFINSGVIKPIIVEPHIYVDFPHKKVGLTTLSKKSIVISKDENLSGLNLNEYYKFYCIGQLIERKGIIETIDTFCNAFTSADKVVLFVKTFKLNYSKEEQQKCLLEIVNVADKYDHAPIIYIKDNLNYDEIKSLHDIGDCYFHLTKTEGFCLGAFDAFNNSKKVIITGYGGHIEYLGKEYEGLVDYELNPLSIDESVFFQFKLDNTYKWAIANNKNAIELLKSYDENQKCNLLNTFKISYIDGLYNLENEKDNQFRWASEQFSLNIDDVNEFEEVWLDYENIIFDSYITQDDVIYKLNIGKNKIKLHVKNTIFSFKCKHFVPMEMFENNNDSRKLSIKLYGIILIKNGKSYYVKIKSINRQSEISKINNGNILFINYFESKGGAEKNLDRIINQVQKTHSYSVLTCLPNGNNSKYWNQKYDTKYLSSYDDINVLKDESKQLSSKYTVIYGNTLPTIKVLHFLKMFNPKLYIILHIHELDSAFVMTEKNLNNNDLTLSQLFKSVDVFIVVANRTKEILLNDYNINKDAVIYIDEKL